MRRDEEYPPRRDGERPMRRDDGYAPRRDGDRPMRRDDGYPPRRDGDRPMRRDDGYAPRRDDDRPRRREDEYASRRDDDRPMRRDDGYAPRRDDRPRRREDEYAPRRDDRPRRRDERDDYRDDERYRRGRDYYEDDYDEDYDDYEDEDEHIKLLMVRIASVVTGILIIMILIFIVKAKLFNNKEASPDSEGTATEAEQEEIDIPEGFTATNDKVVVNYEFLNLRSEPSTSSEIVDKAKEGTELKRIAVSDDGEWAYLKYKDGTVYAAMSYLDVAE